MKKKIIAVSAFQAELSLSTACYDMIETYQKQLFLSWNIEFVKIVMLFDCVEAL